MSVDPTSPAYKEGFKSFAKNRGRYINPYPRGDARHNDFESGWLQRIKRTRHSTTVDLETLRRIEQEIEAKQNERRQQEAAKAYKDRKG